jgi:hypothetical protein
MNEFVFFPPLQQTAHQSARHHHQHPIPIRHTRQMAEYIQNAAQSHQNNQDPLGAKMAPAANGPSANGRNDGTGRHWPSYPKQNGVISGTFVGEDGEVCKYRAERTVEHRRYKTTTNSDGNSTKGAANNRKKEMLESE